MKTIKLLLGLLISSAIASNSFSQTPPPNDNLANATVLTGTDATFSGSLAGATVEDSTDATTYGTNAGSVWWSWTAPTDTVLNLIIPRFQVPGEANLNVYYAPAGITKPAQLPAAASSHDLVNTLYEYLSMPVAAGSNYLIQLAGVNTNAGQYTFHLVATNAPILLRSPVDQTVSSNDCTIFYVVAASLQPKTFQWYFNGTNIPGETAPILAVTNIDATMAGSYSVLVSNASGWVLSAPGTLAISPSNVPPRLQPLGYGSGSMSFSLAGEPGRAYRIQSSSDLKTWTNESSFPFSPAANPNWYGSVVYASNTPVAFNVANKSPSKFYRAAIYAPSTSDSTTEDSELCINNMRQILIAKILWQMDTDARLTVPALSQDIQPYLPHFSSLYCPQIPPDDGTYSFAESYYINGESGQGAPNARF